MTSYTKYRGYPFPSSEREAGNGGLHSELLARAVARDLDDLDTGWSAAQSRPTKIVKLSADSSGVAAGSAVSVPFNTIDTAKVAAAFSTGATEIRVTSTGSGYFYANANLVVQATGALTANARMQVWLRHYRPNAAGSLITESERYGETFWVNSTTILGNRASGMFAMAPNDRLWVYWAHANAASTVKIIAAGTYLSATRIRGL